MDLGEESLEALISKFLTLISLQLQRQKNYFNFTMARMKTSKLNIPNIVREYPLMCQECHEAGEHGA